MAFIAASTFVGSCLARREKTYRVFDLLGIGAIAALMMLGGFTLAYWSNFEIKTGFGVVDGFIWLLVVMVAAALVVKKQDAL